jgi:hypothetical protein
MDWRRRGVQILRANVVPKNRRSSTRRADEYGVFLNVPYDQGFETLYLAYIAGLVAFRLEPKATLQIPGGGRRLDRILDLIGGCSYSFHDLSRVELNPSRPATPRFNMPFELGLAVAWQRFKQPSHTWCVFESRGRRVGKSLSDLSGTDVYVHNGTPAGVFRELCNALILADHQPTVAQMSAVYRGLRRRLSGVKKGAGAKSVFEARVFADLIVVAQGLAAELVH